MTKRNLEILFLDQPLSKYSDSHHEPGNMSQAVTKQAFLDQR